jgi:hypothetical protein
MEPFVLSEVQRRDADAAVALGIPFAYKEATATQVQYAWLKQGFNQTEHYLAYPLIKDLAPSLLAMGLTDEQYASAFNTTVEDVQAIKEYWDFLSVNIATIEAYALIAGEI